MDIDDLDGSLFSSLFQRRKKSDSDTPDALEKGNSSNAIGVTEKSSPTKLMQTNSKNDKFLGKSTDKHDLDGDDLLDLLEDQEKEDILPVRRSKPRLTLTASTKVQALEEPEAKNEPLSSTDIASQEDKISSSKGMGIGNKSEKKTNKSNVMGSYDGTIHLEAKSLPMEATIDDISKKGSRFDDLLGVHGALHMKRESMHVIPLTSTDKKITAIKHGSEKEQQFGNYVPSVFDSLRLNNNSDKNKDFGNEGALLSVSVPAKKSVRFTEVVKPGDGTSLLAGNHTTLQDSSNIKPVRIYDDRVAITSTLEKSATFYKDGAESGEKSVHLLSNAEPHLKAISSDIKSDRLADESQHHPGKDNVQLQTQVKLSRIQQQNAIDGSVAIEQSNENLQLKSLEQLKQNKELEESSRKNETYKVKISEMEDYLRTSELSKKLVQEECATLKSKIHDLENDHRKIKLDSAAQLDELSIKLRRIMAERDDLQLSLDNCKKKHSNEIEVIQKEHGIRLQHIEESYQKRLTRLQEEAESGQRMLNEKIVGLMKEINEHEVDHKKKIESLEIMKTNEVNNVKEIYRVILEDIKKEHQMDKQYCKSLHQQEIETLRNSFSHSSLLSELTQQFKACVQEVDQLRVKIDFAYSKGLDQREQTIKIQEEHLKEMEVRLTKQQLSNDLERDKIQKLIKVLELHVSQQNRQIEQERWQIQQELATLRARETAFEDEKSTELRGIREGHEELKRAKEKLLAEQTSTLMQFLEQKKQIEAEKAQVLMIQEKILQKEQKDAERDLTAEENLTSVIENTYTTAQDANSKTRQQKLNMDKDTLKKQREQLDSERKTLDQKLKEANETKQTAMAAREYGEKCLRAAQQCNSETDRKSYILHLQALELQRGEQALSTERIALIRERRKQQVQHVSRGVENFTNDSSLEQSTLPAPSFRIPMSQQTTGEDARLYQYRSMEKSLSQLRGSICSHQKTQQVIKDKEEVEQQEVFLYSHLSSSFDRN